NPGGQAEFHFSLTADPFDANRVYVGGDRQAVITENNWNQDGDTLGAGERLNGAGLNDWVGQILIGDSSAAAGSQWNRIVGSGANGTAPHADSRGMIFQGLHLLEVDDGGIYRMSEPWQAGRQWESLNHDL